MLFQLPQTTPLSCLMKQTFCVVQAYVFCKNFYTLASSLTYFHCQILWLSFVYAKYNINLNWKIKNYRSVISRMSVCIYGMQQHVTRVHVRNQIFEAIPNTGSLWMLNFGASSHLLGLQFRASATTLSFWFSVNYLLRIYIPCCQT